MKRSSCSCPLSLAWRSGTSLFKKIKTSGQEPWSSGVMGDDSCTRGCGFKSQCRILNGHEIFSHWFAVKIVLFARKDPKNEKEAGVGPFKKINIGWVKLFIKVLQKSKSRSLHRYNIRLSAVLCTTWVEDKMSKTNTSNYAIRSFSMYRII